MPEPPIACTLSPAGMTDRLALIDALAADGLLERTPTASGMRLRLRDTPDIEQRTRELVAAESACCAFLDFALGREDGDLILDITGPQNARPWIELFSAPAAPCPADEPAALDAGRTTLRFHGVVRCRRDR